MQILIFGGLNKNGQIDFSASITHTRAFNGKMRMHTNKKTRVHTNISTSPQICLKRITGLKASLGLKSY